MMKLLLLFLLVSLSSTEVIKHTFTITSSTVSPDCFQRNAVVVNKQLPGPAIYATLNDDIEVLVENRLEKDGFAMHWHGIRQEGTPWADGTPGITQHPIPPGESRVYKFKASHAGTYYYHAHTRLHASTAFGALIVKDPNEPKAMGYDEDRILILSEYYHDDENKLLDASGRFIPGTKYPIGDAVLVNGHSPGPLDTKLDGCASTRSRPSDPAVLPATPDPACVANSCKLDAIEVTSGKTYRLRVINAASKFSMRLNIASHNVKIVEADGALMQPVDGFETDIHIGQRYSLIFKADQRSSNYYITVGVEGIADFRTATVLHYTDAPAVPAVVPANDLSQLVFFNQSISASGSAVPSMRPLNETMNPPSKADRTLVLEINQDGDKYVVNNKTFNSIIPASGPHLLATAYKDPKALEKLDNVYMLKNGEVVDVVVQLGPNFCSTAHPWHVHGLLFWDMGGGPGKYDPETMGANLGTDAASAATLCLCAPLTKMAKTSARAAGGVCCACV